MWNVVNLQGRFIQQQEQRRLGETDARLKLEQKLKRITATTAEKLLDELDEFEKQMQRNVIETWRLKYRYFELA